MITGSIVKCTRRLVVAFGGGSNVAGPARVGAVPWVKPANVTYWCTRTGSLVNTANWANNYGIATPCLQALVDSYGYDGAITLVEHGVAGSSISTWASTYAAELITHCGTAGVRPGLVCLYFGSVDADTPALRDAARTNIQTVVERFRTAWGGGVGVVIGGLHTPEAGYDPANEGVVDGHLLDFVSDRLRDTAAYFDNADAEIQGGGSNHLSDGVGGGADTTGQQFAAIIHRDLALAA